MNWNNPYRKLFFPGLYTKTHRLLVLGVFLFASLSCIAQDVTEVIVTQKLPGPPLWEITHQGNTLWLFADITPLPEKFDWDSSYVERVIANADEFLSKRTFDGDIGIAGIFKMRRGGKLQQLRMKLSSGTTLGQVIDPASLYALKNIMEKWDIQHSSIMQYKPMFAASILYNQVLEKANMAYSDAVLRNLESLRRRHRIPRTKTEISYNAKDFINYLEETQSVPDNFGAQCLEYLLEKMLEMPDLRERSELWYQRDISFREFTENEDMCMKTRINDSQWTKTRHSALIQQWYEHLDNALKFNKNTFAVVDMNLFALPSREFYQWVEANGYELNEPQ